MGNHKATVKLATIFKSFWSIVTQWYNVKFATDGPLVQMYNIHRRDCVVPLSDTQSLYWFNPERQETSRNG